MMAVPRANNKPLRTESGLVARLAQDLDRDNPAIRKRDCLRRIRDPRRNIRIVKRVVERIANDRETMSAMAMEDYIAAVVAAVTEWPVRIGIRRVCVIILVVNPRLDRLPMGHAGGLLIRYSPRQPDCVLRHAFANLAGFYQLLVARRERLKNLRVAGDACFGRGAARKDNCAGRKNQGQRPQENLTL